MARRETQPRAQVEGRSVESGRMFRVQTQQSMKSVQSRVAWDPRLPPGASLPRGGGCGASSEPEPVHHNVDRRACLGAWRGWGGRVSHWSSKQVGSD